MHVFQATRTDDTEVLVNLDNVDYAWALSPKAVRLRMNSGQVVDLSVSLQALKNKLVNATYKP